MLKNISFKNGRALLCIAFSFLLSNATLEAVRTYNDWNLAEDQILREAVAAVKAAATAATVKAIEKLGTDDWEGVARRFKQQCEAADQFQWECAVDPLLSGKTPGQCQNHWIDKLDPSFLSLEHFSRYSPI